jgi:hypothetical protein
VAIGWSRSTPCRLCLSTQVKSKRYHRSEFQIRYRLTPGHLFTERFGDGGKARGNCGMATLVDV